MMYIFLFFIFAFITLSWVFLVQGTIFLIPFLFLIGIIIIFILSNIIKDLFMRSNKFSVSTYDISAAKIKELFIAIFIVYFFFKLELVFLIKTLSLDFFLPIVYGASGVILFILRKHISSNLSKNYGSIESRKLIIIFSISFLYAGIGIFLFSVYNNYHDDIAIVIYNLFDLMLGFQLFCETPGSIPYTHVSDSNTLKMNDSSKDPSIQSESSSSSNSDKPLKGKYLTSKIVESSKLRMDNIELILRIDPLIREIEKLKTLKDVQVVEDEEGSLHVDVPNGMDRNEATLISKRVNIIDSLFTTYSDTITKSFSKHDELCKEMKNSGWDTEGYVKLMDSFKDKFKENSDKFKSLIEKE